MGRRGAEVDYHKRLRRCSKSASFLEALVSEFARRRELLPEGASWLDDVEAERWVLKHMWAGMKPPVWLNASDFFYPYHKYLFAFTLRTDLQSGEHLNASMVVGIECLHARETALEEFPTYEERCRMLGATRVNFIEAIERVGDGRPTLPFLFACHRVHELSWRRKSHDALTRLGILLESATLDDDDIRKTFALLRDHLTELFRVRREYHGGGGQDSHGAPAEPPVRSLRQSGTVRCAPCNDNAGGVPKGARPQGVPAVPSGPHGFSQRKRGVS